MRICIYCNREKEEGEFSQEHILPRAIGGVLQPINPFSTDLVCERCNNIAGFFIDAPFTKSWFINNYRASNATKYTRLTPDTILPLIYMGVIKELAFEGKICENYLGPTGDLIYHFHAPYSNDLDTPVMVGVPPHIRKANVDYGFAFIFLRSNNPAWLPTVIYSFASAFKKSPLYLGNGPTPDIDGIGFKDIPDELIDLHARLWEMQGKQHAMTFTIDVDLGNRFLAKLALGLGCIFLHDSFKTSEDASLLRKFMWTKDREERDKIPIHGSGFIGGDGFENIDSFLKWEGGHVINLLIADNKLLLYSNFYGARGSLIQVTQNKTHWQGKIDESKMFIIMPEMQRCIGPIHMAHLLAHRTSDYRNEDIASLEAEIASLPSLPPFVIQNGLK
ncbi:HNH endonuclease [Flavisolibacter tropicus]|uniref:HNH endonuclease 5 domain-containing protein n=1 Tax=Flavisolibacter tropicus TaxID=1492898 RepID=A0A172TVH4_9BACT|nr:HNH endonuclease [Flavisolibacter tropicus]ANE51085.1 hypothetical protein SY85_11815 [Flavisolibacter tropicus]